MTGNGLEDFRKKEWRGMMTRRSIVTLIMYPYWQRYPNLSNNWKSLSLLNPNHLSGRWQKPCELKGNRHAVVTAIAVKRARKASTDMPELWKCMDFCETVVRKGVAIDFITDGIFLKKWDWRLVSSWSLRAGEFPNIWREFLYWFLKKKVFFFLTAWSHMPVPS